LSEETKEGILPKINDMIAKIGKGEASLLKLNEVDPKVIYANTFAGITPEGFIPNIGVSRELADAIYLAEEGKTSYVFIGNRCYLFKKTKEVKYEEAKYEEIKERVRNDYLNATAQKEIEKLF